MTALLVPIQPRNDHDGNTVFLLNQIEFVQDADTTDSMSCAGDFRSLVKIRTNAVIALNHAGPADDSGTDGIGCRIEDVVNEFDDPLRVRATWPRKSNQRAQAADRGCSRGKRSPFERSECRLRGHWPQVREWEADAGRLLAISRVVEGSDGRRDQKARE